MLESHGYTTIEAIEGNDAIRIHHERREHIDLTILDMVMPEKNREETLDEISRTDPRVKESPWGQALFFCAWRTGCLGNAKKQRPVAQTNSSIFVK